MRILVFTLLAILTLPASVRAAETLTTTQLLSECHSDDLEPMRTSNIMRCSGYLGGLMDGILLSTSTRPDTMIVCPPPGGITPSGFVKLIDAYAVINPAVLGQSARQTAYTAYTRAFPCR